MTNTYPTSARPPNVPADAAFQRVVRKLADEGILLMSDPKLPSIVNLIAKERSRALGGEVPRVLRS